ncbi:histidine kinase [Methylobacterium oryzihabitans]|uniref:Histidine kinase n=1 Tax=Methylobacterium oryzihabitans TaxID=2499852 RepID=A0A3S2VCK5_9HYPH|nr:histidine kinase [Methylobacterium oryzihabitans]RVU19803.1 histidine kinase [Methylobacterium oryzihabitans]
MADYYPLLARALDALPDSSPEMRQAVYERARAALIGQLRSLDPPLSEDDIEAERTSLDGAIARLERERGPAPEPEPAETPAAAVPSAPEPEPQPPPPAHADLPEPGPPVAIRPPSPVRPRPASEDAPAEPGDAPATDDAAPARQRPRIEVVTPRSGGSRLIRNAIVAGVLALVVGAIAFTAWSLRDNPAALQTSLDESEARPPAEKVDSKFADRVGGGERPPQPPATANATSPRTNPDIPVAQRASLVEETGGPNNGPRALAGRAVWRLDAVNPGQGQTLQTVVRTDVEIPEAGLTLAMVLRRNTDATLPASHIIELTFTPTDPGRTVRDIGLVQFKDDENNRGSPVSGLPVPVRDNVFLIGLSNLRADIERNSDLLLHRAWLDLPIRYASGARAILTIEKGAAGERILREAFAQWP